MSTGNWLGRKLADYRGVADSIGFLPSLGFKVNSFLDRRGLASRPYRLRSKRAKFPVWCRPHSSDLYVFSQVFIDLEYSCLDEVVDPKLIVDCGANVGYASVYLLSKFPGARLIAVEPDPDNAKWLRRNLEPFGDRATVLQSGLWSHSVGLVVEANHGDGLEWARQVRESLPGETPDVIATDLGSILEDSGADSISILKVDIEGSEAVVFAQHHERWLDRVENIAIELHGPECERIFHEVIGDDSFRLSRSGELTFGTRTARASVVR
jgi:FkbM family methyltransferase